MFKQNIAGKDGTVVKVEDDGLLVSVYSCPPLLPQKSKIFIQYFTVDGLSTGSADLGVDGSGTSVDYYIPAHMDNDRYITILSFIVGYGAAAYMWEFADKDAALTNGIKLFYQDTNGVEVEIANLKTNYDFLRCATSDGIVPTAWEIRSLGATNDYGFICSIDLGRLLPPYGVKLDRGTTQRLTITIRDDCTDADDFDCKAFGFERFE